MRLRNKKTGVIGVVGYISTSTGDILVSNIHDQEEWYHYKSLAELNEEWEDYEEDKRYWYIDVDGETMSKEFAWFNQAQDDIGNRFETKEEAEKAVEKLKAAKRLKDKGFRFTLTPVVGSLDIAPGKFQIEINAEMPAKWFCCDAVQEDLEACFGGEECV